MGRGGKIQISCAKRAILVRNTRTFFLIAEIIKFRSLARDFSRKYKNFFVITEIKKEGGVNILAIFLVL